VTDDHRVNPMNADEINWGSGDVEHIERVDPLTLDEQEHLAYTRSLQTETRVLRQLLHGALAQLQRMTALLTRAGAVIRQLRRP
jgi:hypothetical protein